MIKIDRDIVGLVDLVRPSQPPGRQVVYRELRAISNGHEHDFAARMDWTIKNVDQANHNPEVVVNGQRGKAPITVEARVVSLSRSMLPARAIPTGTD